ncbi:protein FAM186A [Rousettus aegyptiacus]|uniref:protein FAM186A n=1 Tax=Rousettus aegyptiacus TaxID=9407 RepID=UPI00168CD8CF|nr:protein FAM186A [Rousettus aegyptiacus]
MQNEKDGESELENEVVGSTIMSRKAPRKSVVTKLDIPVSVQHVISKIEQAQLLRARQDINMQLGDIMQNVQRAINRYAFDENIHPGRKISLTEHKKRRPYLLEKIAIYANSAEIREKTLVHILAWLEEWNAILSEMTVMDIDEHHHWIARMEILPETFRAIESNVNILSRISAYLLEEKKKESKKTTSRGTLWKSWKERVIKRPATAHALRPDQMISDEFATNTKVSEIQSMLQELVGTAMFNKLENNAIKYISSTIANLSKALSTLNDEVKVINLQSANMYVSETSEKEKELSLKIIEDLSEKNEMLQQRLQDAEEKCEQLIRSKVSTASPTSTSKTLSEISPQSSVPISKADKEDSMDDILTKELETIVDEAQKKGTKDSGIKWDSAVLHTVQVETTPDLTEQQSPLPEKKQKIPSEDKILLKKSDVHQKDGTDQYQSQKRKHKKGPHVHETSGSSLGENERKQIVSETKVDYHLEQKKLEKKNKEVKSSSEAKSKSSIESKGQHVPADFPSTDKNSQGGKSGASSMWEQPRMVKAEYLLKKSQISSEDKKEPTTESTDKESKSERDSQAEPFRLAQFDYSSEKLKARGKKHQSPSETTTNKEELTGEDTSLFTKKFKSHELVKSKLRITKETSESTRSLGSSDDKSQQSNLEEFQKAIMAFLKEKTDNISKLLDKKTAPKKQLLLKKAEVENLEIIKAKMDEYFQNVTETVTKILRKYKDIKNAQVGEKVMKQKKAVSFTPELNFQKPISATSEIKTLLSNESMDPAIRNLIEMILTEIESERDAPVVSVAGRDHKEKEYLQEGQEKIFDMNLKHQSQEEKNLRKKRYEIINKNMEKENAWLQMEGKQEQKQNQWQDEKIWKKQQKQRMQKQIEQYEKQKQMEEEEEQQKQKEPQLKAQGQKIKEQERPLEKGQQMRKVQQEVKHLELESSQKKKKKPMSNVEDHEGWQKKAKDQMKMEEENSKDLKKIFSHASVTLSPRWKNIRKDVSQLHKRKEFQVNLETKEILSDEKHPIPITPPTPTQSSLPGPFPILEQSPTKSITVIPKKTKALKITPTSEQAQRLRRPFTPEHAKALDTTLTPHQAQSQGITLTPQQAQEQGITITTEQAQAQGITITPQEAQALGITLTPEQAQALDIITLTPYQAQSQGIALTPQQAQEQGITITPEWAKAQGITVTPQQAQALGITLTPQQAQAQGITLTPQQAQSMGITLTPEQAQTLGITLTPEQAQARVITLTPEQARTLGITLTPDQAQSMGITLTPEQARSMGITLTPEQAQTLGITLTPEQAQARVITLTPQQAQTLGITLSLQQAQAQGITLTPDQAQSMGITLTPDQAQSMGITLTPDQAQSMGITLTPEQAQTLGITLTPQQAQAQGITLTPDQAQSMGITLTPDQAQSMGITLTPEQAQTLGITLTPQQAQAQGITLTPDQAQSMGITLTPEQAQARVITLTPKQAQSMGITLTPEQAQSMGITLTPEQAQTLGITLTPEQAQARVITLTPQQAQTLGIALSLQQTQAQGVTLTPDQAQSMGITLTPEQAQARVIILTPQQAQSMGITLTPEQAQSMGITHIHQQAQAQGIALTPQQAQALGITLTSEQAHIQGITEHAQAQQITLTPQQAQALGVALTTEQAQALGITITPEQAHVQGITVTPEQAHGVTHTPQETQALRISLTPQQAHVPEITVTPQQALAQGITLTAEQFKVFLTPEKSQGMGVILTQEQVQASRASLPLEQDWTLRDLITPNQRQTLKPSVTSEQTWAMQIPITTQKAKIVEVPITQRQDKALGVTITPQQTQALQDLLTKRAQTLAFTLTPEKVQTLGITHTHEQAQAVGITLTPEQKQALVVPLTLDQAQALDTSLTTEQAQKLGVPLTSDKAHALGSLFTPEQVQLLGAPFTPGQAQPMHITHMPEQDLKSRFPPINEQSSRLWAVPPSGHTLGVGTFSITDESIKPSALHIPKQPPIRAPSTLGPFQESKTSLPSRQYITLRTRQSLASSAPMAEKSSIFEISSPLQISRFPLVQAPFVPGKSLGMGIPSDSRKLLAPQTFPSSRQTLVSKTRSTSVQIPAPEVPPTTGKLPISGAPLTLGQPLALDSLNSRQFPVSRDSLTPQLPLISKALPDPRQPLISAVTPTSSQVPSLWDPLSPRKPLVPGLASISEELIESGHLTLSEQPQAFQPPATCEQCPYLQVPSTLWQHLVSRTFPEQTSPLWIPSTSGHPPILWAPSAPGKPQKDFSSSVSKRSKERLAIISSPKSKSALVHPSAPNFKVPQASFTAKKFQISEVSDTSGEIQIPCYPFVTEQSRTFQSYLTNDRTPVLQTPYIDEGALPTLMKPITSLPSLTTKLPKTSQILPSEWDQKSRFPPINKPCILTSVSGTEKPKEVPPSSPQELKEQRYFVDVEAQRRNLILLNKATKTSGLPSELHATAKNLITEILHTDTVRLGYLFHKYIAYRLIQRARNNIIKRLQAIQYSGKGYETQNLYIMLSRIDDYQKKVMGVWTEKQKSLEQERNKCLKKMIFLFRQLREMHKLNLSQPIPLIINENQIPAPTKFAQQPFLELLIEDRKLEKFKKLRQEDHMEAIWNADQSTSSYPIEEKTSINSLWAKLGGYPAIPMLLQLDVQSTFRKSLATIQSQNWKYRHLPPRASIVLHEFRKASENFSETLLHLVCKKRKGHHQMVFTRLQGTRARI